MSHHSRHRCPWIAAACVVVAGATACAADVVVCDATTKPASVVFAATEPRPVTMAPTVNGRIGPFLVGDVAVNVTTTYGGRAGPAADGFRGHPRPRAADSRGTRRR